jgi:hypothetical protein
MVDIRRISFLSNNEKLFEVLFRILPPAVVVCISIFLSKFDLKNENIIIFFLQWSPVVAVLGSAGVSLAAFEPGSTKLNSNAKFAMIFVSSLLLVLVGLAASIFTASVDPIALVVFTALFALPMSIGSEPVVLLKRSGNFIQAFGLEALLRIVPTLGFILFILIFGLWITLSISALAILILTTTYFISENITRMVGVFVETIRTNGFAIGVTLASLVFYRIDIAIIFLMFDHPRIDLLFALSTFSSILSAPFIFLSSRHYTRIYLSNSAEEDQLIVRKNRRMASISTVGFGSIVSAIYSIFLLEIMSVSWIVLVVIFTTHVLSASVGDSNALLLVKKGSKKSFAGSIIVLVATISVGLIFALTATALTTFLVCHCTMLFARTVAPWLVYRLHAR